jgi:hypothetical protein
LYPDVGFLQYLTFMTLHPRYCNKPGWGEAVGFVEDNNKKTRTGGGAVTRAEPTRRRTWLLYRR